MREVVVTIILVTILISSAAGCIIGGQSKVKAFVNVFHEGMKNDNSGTLKAWRESEIDKDTIRVRFTKDNATGSFYGDQSYDLAIKCFQKVTDATNFVDSISQDYPLVANALESSSFASNKAYLAGNSAYLSVVGHAPTSDDTYMRFDSTHPFRQKVSMICQMDEFVIYGLQTIVKDFSRGTYVLYLWQPECPPCAPMMERINAVESQYKGTNVNVVKMNLGENESFRDIGKTYNVVAVPTTIFTHNGNITDRFDWKNADQGIVDLSTLLNAVEKARSSP